MSDEMVTEFEEVEEIGTKGKVAFPIDRPMSPSSAMSILKDAELWKYNKENPQDETKAQAFGTALHCMLLEPESFDKKIYVAYNAPVNKSTKKPYGRDSQAYKNWLETVREVAGEKSIITAEEYKELQIIQKMHWVTVEQVCRLGGKGKPIERERKVKWVDSITGQPCLGFIDAMCGNVIIDIKTTSLMDDDEIHKKIKNGYFIQAGAYAEALKQIDKAEDPKVILLFIRSKAPYSLRIVEIDEDDLDRGLLEFRRAIKIYRSCVENGFMCYRGFERMGLPRWKQMQVDSANGKG